MPIDFNVDSFKLKTSIILLLKDSAFPDLNKNPVCLLIIVSASIEPEAFGRVAVEAQSMEKPIIASDIGGSKETIVNNETGFLFEKGNFKSLSEKIIEVLNLDESRLKSIGIEGRKNVVKKFNVEKMCFSTYSEYKKLLN